MYKLSRGMLLLAVALFACCLVLSAIGAVVLLGPWAPVALLALHEQVLTAGQLDVWHLPPERPCTVFVEPLEQRCPPEHNFGVLHRILLAGLFAADRFASRLASGSSGPALLSVNHPAQTDVRGITFQTRPERDSDEANITTDESNYSQ